MFVKNDRRRYFVLLYSEINTVIQLCNARYIANDDGKSMFKNLRNIYLGQLFFYTRSTDGAFGNTIFLKHR